LTTRPKAASDPYVIDRPVHDYVPAGGERWQSVRELIGAKRIRASSSKSAVSASTIDPSRQPWSAFDGDGATRWTAADPADAWIEITFDEPISVAGTTVRLSNGQPGRPLVVRTDAGTTVLDARGGSRTTLDGPVGLTRTLRISAPATGLEPISIDDIEVPGLELSRPLRLPKLVSSWGAPADILLSAEQGTPVCRTIGRVPRCDPGKDGLGEDGQTIDRIVDLPAGQNYAGGLTVLPRQSASMTDAFSGDLTLRASSTGSVSPTSGLLAAIDGNQRTGWISALRDVTPELTIDLGEERSLSKLGFTVDPSLAASAPRRARLEFSNGQTRQVRFDSDGLATFAPVKASSVRVLITDAYVRSSLSFDGNGTGLPVGVSEITLPGSGITPAEGTVAPVSLPCGSGPVLTIDGRGHDTAVSGSREDVVAGRELAGRVCGEAGVAMVAGANRVTVRANLTFRPVLVRLSTGNLALTESTAVETRRNGPEDVTIGPAAGDGTHIVTLDQNINSGWQAGDHTAVTVNGWMQGWVAGSGSTVEARYGIGRVYQAGLGVGAIALLGLLVMTWRLRRRPAPPVVVRPTRSGLRFVVGGAVAATLTVLLAGFGGLALAAVVGAVVLISRGRLGAWIAAVGVGAAGLGYALRPWTDPSGWAGAQAWTQWCVLAALAAAAVLVFEAPLRTSLSRIAGRSTSR
jgi:arabinofuranan 3-O-arabinosyltransferase